MNKEALLRQKDVPFHQVPLGEDKPAGVFENKAVLNLMFHFVSCGSRGRTTCAGKSAEGISQGIFKQRNGILIIALNCIKYLLRKNKAMCRQIFFLRFLCMMAAI